MEKLFSYGTLQLESVQKETFGRELVGRKDSLLGYVLSQVKIKDQAVVKLSGKEFHPMLKYTGEMSDTVDGVVFEITAAELKHADEYEVDEYIRIKGDFISGQQAWIYACADEHKVKS